LQTAVGPGQLEHTAALVDLGDVDRAGALLAGSQHARLPVDAELSATGGDDLPRADVRATGQNFDIQTFFIPVTKRVSGVETGELRLNGPLRLQADGDDLFAVCRILRDSRRNQRDEN